MCDSASAAERVLGQLKATVHRNYSNLPNFGAQVVAQVLNEPALNALWSEEGAAMRQRILAMRQSRVAALKVALPEPQFDYLLRQRGMFSYTGFSPVQVAHLREVYGVYLIDSGRMCLAGLNTANVGRVAQAFTVVQWARPVFPCSFVATKYSGNKGAGIMWYQQTLTLKARPRGFHLVTDEIVSQLTSLSAVRTELLHLLLQHTSASLTLNENCDPTVRTDMENHFYGSSWNQLPTSTIMKGRMTCRHISNLLCLALHCYARRSWHAVIRHLARYLAG